MESKRSGQWQAWLQSICEEHTVTPGKTGRFEPNPDDAFKLAALQWWTHTIGRVAIEVYATDRRQFDRMSKILSDATAAMQSLDGRQRLSAIGGGGGLACETDQDCPRGYYCADGTCEPIDAGSLE